MKFLGIINDNKDFTSKEFVEDVVDVKGGKIDTISVDNNPLEIVDKHINIDLSGKADKTTVIFNEVSKDTVTTTAQNNGDSFSISSVDSVTDDTSLVELSDTSIKLSVDDTELVGDKTGFFYKKSGNQSEIATVKNVEDAVKLSIKKLDTAETGFVTTYHLLDANGNKLGDSINLPKDLVVKSAELKTVTQEDSPVEGYKVGDKYIDFIISTISSQDHIYLNVKELIDIYTGGNGINIDSSNKVSAVVVAENGLSVGTDGIKLAVVTDTTNGAMPAELFTKVNAIEAGAEVNKIESVSSEFVIDSDKELTIASGLQFMTDEQVAKLGAISEGATKVEETATNGSIKIDGVEKVVYTHPTVLAEEPVAVKVGKDVEGHVVLGSALALSDLSTDASHRTVTDIEKQLWAEKQSAISDIDTIRSKAYSALQEHQSLELYRKASVQDAIDAGKQATISDLETIRLGAASGATAVQPSAIADMATKTWVEGKNYISEHQSLSAYRTAAEQDLLNQGKQDVVSDLATIRSGAASGATAVQPDAIADMATQTWVEGKNYISEHQSLVEYRKSAAQDEIDASKQDKITESNKLDYSLIANTPDLSSKQDKITDLDVIIAGASAGATAVQPADISDIATKTWVGQQGFITAHQSLEAYRTASAQDAIDAGKQATISDLDTIRSGASAGATAVQPSAISDMATKTWVGQQGYLTDHQSLTEYRTASAQDTIDSGKQDTISDLETIRSGASAGATAVQPESISDMATKTWVGQQGFLQYQTTEPTEANTDGLKLAVLDSEPAQRYAGWIYFISQTI